MTCRDDFARRMMTKLDSDGRMFGIVRHDFDELAALLLQAKQVALAVTRGKFSRDALAKTLEELAALACSIACEPGQALNSLIGYRIVPHGDPVGIGFRIEQFDGTEWFTPVVPTLGVIFPDSPSAFAAIEKVNPNHHNVELPTGAPITPTPGRLVPRMSFDGPVSIGDMTPGSGGSGGPVIKVENGRATLIGGGGAADPVPGTGGGSGGGGGGVPPLALGTVPGASGGGTTGAKPFDLNSFMGEMRDTFRVVEVLDGLNKTGEFFVQVQTPNDAAIRWTGRLDASFEPELFPFRQFNTVDDAEAAILAWGKRTGSTVTVIRADGETVTAAPGAGPFPRKIADRVQFYPYNADTNQPPEAIRSQSGVYRIRPDMVTGDGGWLVWHWDPESQSMFSMFKRPGFRSFSAAIASIENAQPVNAIHIELPRPVDVERWRKAGFVVDLPGYDDPIDEGDLSAGSFGNPTPPPADPVTIPASIPYPVGTRFPIAVDDDLWAVDEWTGTQWKRVADDLEWSEIEAHLKQPEDPASPSIPAGECEIRGRPGAASFDVFQWDGRAWKQIAGDVALATAKGVVRARAMEAAALMGQRQEMPATMKAGVIKQWRRLMKEVRADLVEIKAELQCRPEPDQTVVDIVDRALARFTQG